MGLAYCILVLHLLVSSGFADLSTLQENNMTEEEIKLEEYVRKDILAETIWNYTHEHDIFSSKAIEVGCLAELKYYPEAIAPYLVNITLNLTIDYIGDFLYNNYINRQNKLRTIKQAKEISYHVSEFFKQEEIYSSNLQQVLEVMGYAQDELGSICYNSYTNCSCIDPVRVQRYKQERDDLLQDQRHLQEYITFGVYVDPSIRVIPFLIGLTLNITILVIFIRESAVRNESNIIIFHLILNNIIILTAYLPLGYFYLYHRHTELCMTAYSFVETLVVSMNALVILALNAKMYFDVSRLLKPTVDGCRTTSVSRCLIWTAQIWLTSIIITTLICITNEDNQASLQVTLYFFGYLFLLAIALAIFNAVTARKLQSAAERERLSNELQLITGSKLIIMLTVAYFIIHVPFYFILPVQKFGQYRNSPYLHNTIGRIITVITNLIFGFYPSVSCYILYKCSSTYRRYFNKYLFRCWFNNEEGQYVTMSSLRNEES